MTDLKLRVSWDVLDIRPDGLTFYEGRPFEGFACEFSDGGRVREETEFRQGTQTGVSRTYDEMGALCLEEHFDHGNLHGLLRAWHTNGQLAREAEYEFSVLMRDRTWDEHGKTTLDHQIDPSDPRLTVVQAYRQARTIPSQGSKSGS